MSSGGDGSTPGGESEGVDREWDVVGPEGFARLRLGDAVDGVRGRFGAHVTFRRTPDADKTDHFPDAGVMATYDVNRRITFLEVVEPATPRVVGVPLLGAALDDVVAALAAHGVEVVRDPDGGTVVGWAVGLYAPDGTVEGVSIGEPVK
ncbi:hypothetical protein AB6N24_19155 [Cellulomonas sp. 179-A 4D5 NHS]|uniref:hypothetical protein n=1 Tax=Cellulomonas sp. 179-A 4D5 NHS TaxID=3142378 RepID=UPI0039A02304